MYYNSSKLPKEHEMSAIHRETVHWCPSVEEA